MRINRRGAGTHAGDVDIFLIDVVENWKITGDNIDEEGGEVGMCVVFRARENNFAQDLLIEITRRPGRRVSV